MKNRFLYRLSGAVCLLVFLSAHAVANKNEEGISLYIPHAETILLDRNETYGSNITEEQVAKSAYYQCTLIDSSGVVVSTLRGKCWYQLYFDTTNMESGKELQRTKDSLVVIGRLNRTIDSYRFEKIAKAPHEILVTDSLIRRSLRSKRIWMHKFFPHYDCAPFHPVVVDFTIIPLKKEDDEKAVEKKKR